MQLHRCTLQLPHSQDAPTLRISHTLHVSTIGREICVLSGAEFPTASRSSSRISLACAQQNFAALCTRVWEVARLPTFHCASTTE